jgi:hypothetical protein
MLRLKHSLAKLYGYAGSLEGWQGFVHVPKPKAPQPMPSAPQADKEQSRRNRPARLVWTYRGGPQCRSIPDVARALGLQLRSGANNAGSEPSSQSTEKASLVWNGALDGASLRQPHEGAHPAQQHPSDKPHGEAR